MNTDELLIPEEYRQEIRSIKAELEELEAKKVTIRGRVFEKSGSQPFGNSGAYFENDVIKYDVLYSKLLQTTAEYTDVKYRLFRKINRLENQSYANILCYRYIQGFTIKKIMNICECNQRQVYKVLRSAKEEYERMNEDDESR